MEKKYKKARSPFSLGSNCFGRHIIYFYLFSFGALFWHLLSLIAPMYVFILFIVRRILYIIYSSPLSSQTHAEAESSSHFISF